jgi:hypothetical protein
VVTPVTEFLISVRGIPKQSFAATYARGYPVALLANAELLDSLAFTLNTKFITFSRDYFDKFYLNNVIFIRIRAKGVLDVAFTNNSQTFDDFDGDGSQLLILPVVQGLTGSDNDTFSSVDAEGIQIFHVANLIKYKYTL